MDPKEQDYKISKIRNFKEDNLPAPTPVKLVDIKERQGSIRTGLSFLQVSKQEFEDKHDYEKLRKRLIRLF